MYHQQQTEPSVSKKQKCTTTSKLSRQCIKEKCTITSKLSRQCIKKKKGGGAWGGAWGGGTPPANRAVDEFKKEEVYHQQQTEPSVSKKCTTTSKLRCQFITKCTTTSKLSRQGLIKSTTFCSKLSRQCITKCTTPLRN